MTSAPARRARGAARCSQGRPVGKIGAMNRPTPAYAYGASAGTAASSRQTVMPAHETVMMDWAEKRSAIGATRKRPTVIISQYTEVAVAATPAP